MKKINSTKDPSMPMDHNYIIQGHQLISVSIFDPKTGNRIEVKNPLVMTSLTADLSRDGLSMIVKPKKGETIIYHGGI